MGASSRRLGAHVKHKAAHRRTTMCRRTTPAQQHAHCSAPPTHLCCARDLVFGHVDVHNDAHLCVQLPQQLLGHLVVQVARVHRRILVPLLDRRAGHGHAHASRNGWPTVQAACSGTRSPVPGPLQQPPRKTAAATAHKQVHTAVTAAATVCARRRAVTPRAARRINFSLELIPRSCAEEEEAGSGTAIPAACCRVSRLVAAQPLCCAARAVSLCRAWPARARGRARCMTCEGRSLSGAT